MMSIETQSRLWRMGGPQIAVATLLGVAAALMVWRVAWVTEDCFITFRYVANTLAGRPMTASGRKQSFVNGLK